MTAAGVQAARARRAGKLTELWKARELLRNLVVRELKVRYKNSVLGFGWSMITPLAMMGIFTFIFTKIFVVPLRDFPLFFLAGFLPWIYFSNSVMGSVGAVVQNAHLIKKVYFPREVLPLSIVLAQGVHFLLSLCVLAAFLIYRGYNFLPFLHLLILAIVFHTLLNCGLAMLFAAANVGFRDLQELVQVIFLLWFYATPIFYSAEMAPERYRPLLRLNPMTWFVELYRSALYGLRAPRPALLLGCAAFALVSVVLGYAFFTRQAVTFAKEI